MLTFYTVNGFDKLVPRYLAKATSMVELLNNKTGLTEGMYQPMALEIAHALIVAHNVLNDMVGEDSDELSNDIEVKAYNILGDTPVQFFTKSVTFVLGAVADPYLYADNNYAGQEGYQQAAVVGLIKAKKVLRALIDNLAR